MGETRTCGGDGAVGSSGSEFSSRFVLQLTRIVEMNQGTGNRPISARRRNATEDPMLLADFGAAAQRDKYRQSIRCILGSR